MGDTGYTRDRGTQIVVSLMRQHGVRRVVASPGTMNIGFVRAVQLDPAFEVWSSADERSAAYIACGMAAATGEPVAISCTGATAARDYYPGMTEAFYRRLPVLAITSSHAPSRVGHLVPQVTDRSDAVRDAARVSVTVPRVTDAETEWEATVAANRAMLELTRRGGGPAHIDLVSEGVSQPFDVGAIRPARAIFRHLSGDDTLPEPPAERVVVLVGSHAPFDAALEGAVEAFCETWGAVVLCDQTSNYRGAHRVLYPLSLDQRNRAFGLAAPGLAVHVGEVSGSHLPRPGEVWRVSESGELQDPMRALTHVFEMGELEFFERYARGGADRAPSLETWEEDLRSLRASVPELPFSNAWMARECAPRLPEGCVLHLAILNSLRCWNLFETPASVECMSNVGGFGIDGCLSTLVGSSLARPERTHILVTGDLAFFYDMNALGNRHVGPNVRVLLVNNGLGAEFTRYSHPGSRFMPETEEVIAAGGHYGRQSRDLVRHYATDLGLEYLSAVDKGSFLAASDALLDPAPRDRPLLVEAFTDPAAESDALYALEHLVEDAAGRVKAIARGMLGETGVRAARRLLGR